MSESNITADNGNISDPFWWAAADANQRPAGQVEGAAHSLDVQTTDTKVPNVQTNDAKVPDVQATDTKVPATKAPTPEQTILKARDILGIRQCVQLLLTNYPEECARVPDLLKPEIRDDNKSYRVKGRGMGDVVEYVARVLNTGDEFAAEYILEMVENLSEEDRGKLAPDCQPVTDDLDPFPLDDMPLVLRGLAEVSMEINKSKPELSVVTMLAVISAAIGKGLELKTTKGRRVTGNLLMVISMPTGTGKTSEAGPLLDMLHAFQRKLRLDHRKLGYRKAAELAAKRREIEKLETAAASDEAPADQAQFDADMERLFALKDEESLLLASMAEPSVITEDATAEGLIIKAAQNNGVIASMSTDARDAVENLNGRYSSGSTAGANIYLKGYSGDVIDQVRVGRGTLSTKPRVTVLWLVQPDLVKGLFTREDFRVSGLAPRFLVCHIEPTMTLETYEAVDVPEGMYAGFQARLDEVLTTYYGNGGTPHEVQPTVAAGTLIVDYRNTVATAAAAGDLSGCEEFATRWAEQAWRIALVLHVAEHGASAHQHALEERTARGAVRVTEWFSLHQAKLVSATSGEKTDQKLGVAKEFVRAHQEGVAPYELYRKHQGMFKDAKEAKAVLDELVAEGGINRVGASRKPKYSPMPLPKRR